MKLSKEKIIKNLKDSGRIRPECFGEVDSTNNIAKKRGLSGEPEGYLAVAESQTAGRGRLGRTFVSPENGIYMSLLLRPSCSPAEALRITPIAAVAVAEAITALCGRRAEIKWVNDIYMDGRKVCGILTESVFASETEGLDFAVLGIGINLSEPEGGFPKEISDIAGAIYEYKKAPENFREQLIAEVWNRFMECYRDLGNPEIVGRYREYSFLPGRQVLVIENTAAAGDARPATVLGIGDDYGLLVRYEDGAEETLSTGEVSLKLQN